MAEISILNLKKTYGAFTAVEDFTLSIADGEFVSILGPSGCGKTTLLRSIAGFFSVTSGEIRIGNTLVVSSEARVNVPPEDRNLGMVFQSYAVWPHMNVYDNVAYPLRIRKMPTAAVREKVGSVLELLKLTGSEEKYPSMMSGGQQQRIALGRALVMDPDALLLDEPLSNLDSKLREQMRFELKEIQQKLNLTILYVTHDQEEAMAVSDRIVLMNKGQIQQVDNPRNLYCKPENLFSARFLGRSNKICGTVTEITGDKVVIETSSGAAVPAVLSLSSPLEKGSSATAVVRYEKTELSKFRTDESVPARVIVGTYFGSYFLYAVETAFGEIVAHTDSSVIYHPGDDVFLRFSDTFLFKDEH